MNPALGEAFALLQNGRAVDAERRLQGLIDAGVVDRALYQLLGMALAAQQRDVDAIAAFRRGVELAPDDPSAQINLANALRRIGEATEARALLERVEQRAGRSAELDANIGLAALATCDFLVARERLLRAVRAWPQDVELLLCLVQVELELGEEGLPRQMMQRLADAPRAHPDWSNQAGVAWSLLNEPARAEAMYRHALALDPRHEQALANLLALLERINRLEDAGALLDQAAAVADPSASALLIARARIAVRRKQLAEADMLYGALYRQTLPERVALDVAYEYGKLLDRLDRPAEAIAALQRGHRLSLTLLERNHPETFHNPPRDDWDDGRPVRLDPASWTPLPAGLDALPADPIFVVGFPRSGTTLLEQILGSHPQLQPMDEVLALERAIAELAAAGIDYPDALADPPPAVLAAARAAYWDEVARALPVDRGRRLVDKYPFNLVRLPAIARLFPNAKVVLLLRHPADCVLSCYMQKFRLNKGTHAWATLESTARLYGRALDTWQRHRAMLSVPVHVLKYESLVRDFEPALRALVDFLELPWDDRVTEYRRTAVERGRISTPSYAQVTEPIYDRAIGRWQRYRPWMADALAELAPYCREFDYPID